MTSKDILRARLAAASRTVRGRFGDSLFKSIAFLAATGIVVLMGLLVYKLYQTADLSIKEFGLGFLTSEEWDPVKDIYGAKPFIYGTIVSSLLALAMAVPLSLGIAIYLSQFAPRWLRSPLAFVVNCWRPSPAWFTGSGEYSCWPRSWDKRSSHFFQTTSASFPSSRGRSMA